jgi:hypothetical protein
MQAGRRNSALLIKGKKRIKIKHIYMNPEVTVNEVVAFYTSARQSSSVADAATLTLRQFGITPSLLVDAFNAAQLDLSRPDAEAEVIRSHRNELLSHFNTEK